MSTQQTYPELPGPVGDEPEEASGPSAIHWGLLVLGAAMRRKALAAAIFLMGLGVLVAYYKLKTPLYRVEASILVLSTSPLAHSSPEEPARSANALVHRRENLIDLIRQTNLLVEAGAAPVTIAARLSRLLSFLTRAPPANDADEPMIALVLRLDRALEVTTGVDGTINIRIDWPDPQQAYRLVETAQQNFLEARHVQEITAVDEVISILQGRTSTLREQLDRTIEEVQRDATLKSVARSSDGSARSSAPRSDPAAARTKAEELVSLKSMLDAKERAITDLEDFRRRRLAELMAQLEEKRGMYSDTYPGVVTLRQDVEALSRESPQIASLRHAAQKLRDQYLERLAKERANEGATRTTSVATPADRAERAVSSPVIEQDERVREARARYVSMVDRLATVQLELDSARSAFKHRYSVAWPAEVPGEPFSPKPLKVLGLGSVAVLLLALLGAAAPDLWSGRIVQRWQIERSLELPVLVELSRK